MRTHFSKLAVGIYFLMFSSLLQAQIFSSSGANEGCTPEISDPVSLVGDWQGNVNLQGVPDLISVRFLQRDGQTKAQVSGSRGEVEVLPCGPNRYHFTSENKNGEKFRYHLAFKNNRLEGDLSPANSCSKEKRKALVLTKV